MVVLRHAPMQTRSGLKGARRGIAIIHSLKSPPRFPATMARTALTAAAATLLLLLCTLLPAQPAAAQQGAAVQHMLQHFRAAVEAGVEQGRAYRGAAWRAFPLSHLTTRAVDSICDTAAAQEQQPAGLGMLPMPGTVLAGAIAGDVDAALSSYIRVPLHALAPAGRLVGELAATAHTRVSAHEGRARGRGCPVPCA